RKRAGRLVAEDLPEALDDHVTRFDAPRREDAASVNWRRAHSDLVHELPTQRNSVRQAAAVELHPARRANAFRDRHDRVWEEFQMAHGPDAHAAGARLHQRDTDGLRLANVHASATDEANRHVAGRGVEQ